MFAEVIVFLLVIVYYYLNSNSEGKIKRRRLPPGPIGLPLLGYLPFMGKIPSFTITELSKRYGNIFSLYLGNYLVVFVNDYESMKEMGKIDAFQGRNQLELMQEPRGYCGLGLLEGKDWQDWRRFTLKSLRDMGFGKRSMEGMIQQQVQEARAFLTRNANKAMYLKPPLEIAAINCIWQILTSEKYDLEDPRMRNVYHIMSEGFADQNMVGITAFLPWLAKLAPDYTGYTKGLRYLGAPDKLGRDILKSHMETYSPDHERDFIDVALTRIYNTTDPSSMFYKDVGLNNLRFTIVDLFFAGADTLSSTLGWAFMYLAAYPEVQKKVHQEIDSNIEKSGLPTLADRSKLPYVEATMFEVLRKSSMVPMGLMHTATEDCNYQGYFFPKRTVILWNLYHVHHDVTYWGDPENFRPDRFITAEGTVRKDERLIPFFTGKRSCPAESLANNEFFLFFTGILQNFEFSLEPNSSPPYLGQRSGFILKPPEHKLVVNQRCPTNSD